MTQNQKGILWVGLLVVLVFLFTSPSFRNSLFGRGTSKPAAAKLPYTAAQIFQANPAANQIILDAASGIPATAKPPVTVT